MPLCCTLTPPAGTSVDVYNPRVQATSLFNKGKIKLGDEETITSFSNKYIVDSKLVKSRIEHLETLLVNKQKKNQQKTVDDGLTYEEIDWDSHVKKNTLKNLEVAALNKYLLANKLHHHLHLKKA